MVKIIIMIDEIMKMMIRTTTIVLPVIKIMTIIITPRKEERKNVKETIREN